MQPLYIATDTRWKNDMTRTFLVRCAVLFFALAFTARAADSIATTTGVVRTDSATTVKDSVTHVQPLSLLPEKLGPMESLMWSEHGLMRNHFDFPLTEDGRDKEMHLRRTMLTLHQVGGFATLAAMLATVAVGQVIYNDYPGRASSGMNNLKSTLGWTTVWMYFGTASLSVFTPPPLVRHNEWSTISTHKLLATIHFTGMIVTPILASYIGGERRPGSTISRNAETAHMISGYATTAAFAAAMMVVTF